MFKELKGRKTALMLSGFLISVYDDFKWIKIKFFDDV